MLPSGSLNTVSPTTSCFRGSITRLACSLSTLSGWAPLPRSRLACGLPAMLWPRGAYTHWVSISNFKVASTASFPNEPGLPWRNKCSRGSFGPAQCPISIQSQSKNSGQSRYDMISAQCILFEVFGSAGIVHDTSTALFTIGLAPDTGNGASIYSLPGADPP